MIKTGDREAASLFEHGAICVRYGAELAMTAKALLDAAGVGPSLPRGGRVSLKPNFVVARPAAQGATTHPGVLAGIIEYCLDHGVKEVEILESSWLGEDTERAFAACGARELAGRYGVRLFDLKKDETLKRETPAGRMQVCRRAAEAEFLVNVPVLKGHCQTRLTCALKNMKGCIPDAEKRRFHRENLHACIAALGTAIRPLLTVVDGICGDLEFEEGGNPVQANRLFAGKDPVRIDAYACRLMGIAVEEVAYIGMAARHGVGSATLRSEDVLQGNRPGPAPVPQGDGMRRYAACMRPDQACSACQAALVHALKRLEEAEADIRRLPPIHIGQGWRGKVINGLGVGECCHGASRHVRGCPPEAEMVVRILTEAQKH